MKFGSHADPAGTPVPVVAIRPASCPTCRSLSIVTSAKLPDADSYWRCMSCGEVWNDSRWQTPLYSVRQHR